MTRFDRINELLKQEIALVLQRRVADGRIGFVSITNVEVSRDLKHAKVYYSHLGTKKEREKSSEGLKSASRFIKGEISKVIKMRSIPDLHFVYDESLERGFNLVNKIRKLTSS